MFIIVQQLMCGISPSEHFQHARVYPLPLVKPNAPIIARKRRAFDVNIVWQCMRFLFFGFLVSLSQRLPNQCLVCVRWCIVYLGWTVLILTFAQLLKQHSLNFKAFKNVQDILQKYKTKDFYTNMIFFHCPAESIIAYRLDSFKLIITSPKVPKI